MLGMLVKCKEVAMSSDPEIQAMSKISEALSGLDEDARVRVLRWALDRYAASSALSVTPDQDLVDQRDVPDLAQFTHLGDLYDAADPSTDGERALVASYWFQQIEGQSDVDALSVNNALKQLGYGIGNITRAFTRLQTQKPVLIQQLQKKGTTKQARKKYRVTAAGKRTVQEMVYGAGE